MKAASDERRYELATLAAARQAALVLLFAGARKGSGREVLRRRVGAGTAGGLADVDRAIMAFAEQVVVGRDGDHAGGCRGVAGARPERRRDLRRRARGDDPVLLLEDTGCPRRAAGCGVRGARPGVSRAADGRTADRSRRDAPPAARRARDAALRGDPDVHAGAAHDRPRRRRRGRLRHPVRHGDELPHRAALRPRGDPLGVGAPAAVQPGARRRTSSRRSRSSTTATCPSRRATPSGRTARSRRRSRRSSRPASSRSRSAATTRSRSPSCACSRGKHGPLALVQLDAHGDTWDEYFGQRFFHGTTFKRAVEEGLIDAAASVQAGMRGSLYAAEDIESARELGFAVLPCDELRDARAAAATASLVRDAGRRASRLPLLRHRRPRPGVRARHGHAGGRRALDRRGARLPARAARDQRSPAPTSSRSRRRTTAPGQQTALAAANVAYELLSLRALGAQR